VIEFRPLRESDDRTGFHSGDLDLDRFFSRYAGQNQFRHHVGSTHVAVEGGKILGYATVAAAHLEVEGLTPALRKRFPRYPLPVLRLARLAVDASEQRRGIGSALLRHVLELALAMADLVGCVGVVVDAKPDAKAFYEKLGFAVLPVLEGMSTARPMPPTMFLPLEAIADRRTRAGRRN
jgi:GNAT superfamily N-acetyltransferase